MDPKSPNTSLDATKNNDPNKVSSSTSTPFTVQDLSTIGHVSVMPYSKPFPDISKIEMFGGQNYKRWQERIYALLDMHGVATALVHHKPDGESVDPKEIEFWIHANKVCRHTIISTLTNDLFDATFRTRRQRKFGIL